MLDSSRSNNVRSGVSVSPLAITGIGCRFSGDISDPQSFWNLVVNGKDGIRPVPEDRWNSEMFYDPDPSKPGRMFVREGGFMDRPLKDFDALFFGISPREAERMDPQQRLMLETSWEALEDAGLAADQLAGSRTGVFVGAFTFDHQVTQLGTESRDLISAQTPTSSTFTMLSNRLSYFYDFRGPSVSIDTACSSSLVAFHQACQSIWSGESDMVLAGGANVMYRPETMISMCKGQFLAPDGRSKSFDERANGYGRGEGAGVVVIRRLEDALEDGDRIYSVVRATGVNQDGRTNGITVPNPVSQQAIAREVCETYGIDPATIDLVEAHGTGTPVGDPIEANSLGSVYGQARPEGETIALGSVKANIGHTEAAAGVAGVIKASLSLYHGTIPPVANLGVANPDIPFDDLGLRLPREAETLDVKGRPARAAVNSFGYGGTNAHAILEAPDFSGTVPMRQTDVAPGSETLLFPISARSEDALASAVESLLEQLPQLTASHSIADICANAARRRSHHAHRLLVRCNDADDLATKLRTFIEEGQAEGVIAGRADAPATDKPVFVYTGMGPQWWGMGRDLMAEEPVFREAVEECDKIFTKIAGWSIAEEMARDEAESRVKETQIAQPANFVVQYALTKLLAARGIEPAAIVGHSVGEVTSACIAGVLSLADAISVSFHRSRIQKKAAGQGTMLAVGLPEAQARELIAEHGELVSIAAINSPNSVTLAGQTDIVETLAVELEAQGVFNRILDVEVPYHSHYMEALKPEVRECLAHLAPRRPTVPLFSTVTGADVQEVTYDAEYWCDNIREPVYFAKAMGALIDAGHSIFLEVGPHPVLSTSIKECVATTDKPGVSAGTLRRGKPEGETFWQGISNLYCSGLDLNWDKLLPAAETYVPLPLYQFQRQSLWFESKASQKGRMGSKGGHPLLAERLDTAVPAWCSSLNEGLLPFIPDHVVDGLVLFPAAGYIEAALAAEHSLIGSDATVLSDIEFNRALVVEPDVQPALLSISYDPFNQTFQVSSKGGDVEDDTWTVHAQGVISSIAPELVPTVDLAEVKKRCASNINVEATYDALAARGLEYGERFRRIASLQQGKGEVLARIEQHHAPGQSYDHYRLHPALLDACFHSLIATVDPSISDQTFVPVGVDKLILRQPPEGSFWCLGTLEQADAEKIVGHFQLVSDDGEVIAEIRGFRCQALAAPKQSATSLLNRISYQMDWEALDPLVGANATLEKIVLVGFDAGILENYRSEFAAACDAELVVLGDSTIAANSSSSRRTLNLADEQELVSAFAELGQVDAVVWLAQGATGNLAGLDDVNGLSALMRALDEFEISPRLYAISHKAMCVVAGDSVDGLAQSPVTGLMQVGLNEYPHLRSTTLDTDGSALSDGALVAEILAGTDEDALAFRNGDRFGHRTNRAAVGELTNAAGLEAPVKISRDEGFELDQTAVGNLNSLVLRQAERRAPEAGEIEVKLSATALNFKDVAKAMNIISDAALEGTFHGRGLGLEASGHVVRVGEGVTECKVGDRLVFSVVGSFRRYATLKYEPHLMGLVDDKLDLVECAGIPTVFMTAWHGLVDIAHLQPREKVLIHAGAGGVGLAAIQIAQHIGAEIFATAGSETKREYLRSLGVQHVMNSRSLDFAEEIQEITGGTGVDVVLNSLPKEYIHKSLAALAPFGRFLEIGKKDLAEGTNISLEPFNNVLTFASIDFDLLVARRPDIAKRVQDDIFEMFEKGVLEPVRTEVFPASELSEAFKHMARSQHMGKVVIDWDADEEVEVLPDLNSTSTFRPDAKYLITGGCGGFGLAMAERLVAKGVRHLALSGRSGAKSDEAKAAIDAMTKAGASVEVLKVDVTDAVATQKMIKTLAQGDMPLKGVFHAAAVLDDAPISELDRDRFEAVMRPKIAGAMNLDAAVEGIDLDYFVLFSSVASVIGNARQANYVAANKWFDEFASARRARGLPALSVNWGPIADVGMAAGNELLVKTLAASGFTATTVDEAVDALEVVLRWDVPQVGLFDLDWAKWSTIAPSSGSSPRFASLLSQGVDGAENPLQAELTELAPELRLEILNYALIQQLADTLRFPADKIEPSAAIADLGMDSLMAVELQTSVSINMGVELSPLEMMKAETVSELGGVILKKMSLPGEGDDTAAVPTAAVQKAEPEPEALEEADIDEMSDEEVDRLLATVVGE